MKILAITVESPDNIFGGMGEHIKQLYHTMDCNVTILSLDEKITPRNYKVASPSSVVYGIPRRGFQSMQENNRRLLVEAIKLCKDTTYDVIHCHDWPTVQVGLDVRDITGIPVVTTFHLFQHQIMLVEGLPTTQEVAYSIGMEFAGLAFSDAVIINSTQMQNYIQEEFKINRQVSLIPNGVVVPEFNIPKDEELRSKFPDKPIVLFSGRIAKQKGIEEIFKAVELSDKYFWIIMGKLSALDQTETVGHPYRVELERLEKKYPERIKWVGHITEDRAKYYSIADHGVMPSICEPFGIVALEFFASHTPIVTTAVDGMRDFITKDNASIIDGSAKSIIEGLSRIPKVGFETAKRHNWKNISVDTTKVYQEAICNGKNRT